MLSRHTLLPFVVAPAIAVSGIAADLHTILLPVYSANSSFPGASGSRWMTTLTTYNASADLITFVPCGIPNRCPPDVFVLNPRVTEHNPTIGFTDAGPNGRLIYLRSEDARHVFFRLTATDVLRNSPPTQIPVVHEQDFRTSLLELLEVPVTQTSRTLLRIYDVDDRDGSAVLVRIFDSDDVVFEQLLPFSPSGYAHPGGAPFAPAVISLPLQTLRSPTGKVRIEIEPMTPQLRFWAFATVTDNSTSEVSVFSPQ